MPGSTSEGGGEQDSRKDKATSSSNGIFVRPVAVAGIFQPSSKTNDNRPPALPEKRRFSALVGDLRPCSAEISSAAADDFERRRQSWDARQQAVPFGQSLLRRRSKDVAKPAIKEEISSVKSVPSSGKSLQNDVEVDSAVVNPSAISVTSNGSSTVASTKISPVTRTSISANENLLKSSSTSASKTTVSSTELVSQILNNNSASTRNSKINNTDFKDSSRSSTKSNEKSELSVAQGNIHVSAVQASQPKEVSDYRTVKPKEPSLEALTSLGPNNPSEEVLKPKKVYGLNKRESKPDKVPDAEKFENKPLPTEANATTQSSKAAPKVYGLPKLTQKEIGIEASNSTDESNCKKLPDTKCNISNSNSSTEVQLRTGKANEPPKSESPPKECRTLRRTSNVIAAKIQNIFSNVTPEKKPTVLLRRSKISDKIDAPVITSSSSDVKQPEGNSQKDGNLKDNSFNQLDKHSVNKEQDGILLSNSFNHKVQATNLEATKSASIKKIENETSSKTSKLNVITSQNSTLSNVSSSKNINNQSLSKSSVSEISKAENSNISDRSATTFNPISKVCDKTPKTDTTVSKSNETKIDVTKSSNVISDESGKNNHVSTAKVSDKKMVKTDSENAGAISKVSGSMLLQKSPVDMRQGSSFKNQDPTKQEPRTIASQVANSYKTMPSVTNCASVEKELSQRSSIIKTYVNEAIVQKDETAVSKLATSTIHTGTSSQSVVSSFNGDRKSVTTTSRTITSTSSSCTSTTSGVLTNGSMESKESNKVEITKIAPTVVQGMVPTVNVTFRTKSPQSSKEVKEENRKKVIVSNRESSPAAISIDPKKVGNNEVLRKVVQPVVQQSVSSNNIKVNIDLNKAVSGETLSKTIQPAKQQSTSTVKENGEVKKNVENETAPKTTQSIVQQSASSGVSKQCTDVKKDVQPSVVKEKTVDQFSIDQAKAKISHYIVNLQKENLATVELSTKSDDTNVSSTSNRTTLSSESVIPKAYSAMQNGLPTSKADSSIVSSHTNRPTSSLDVTIASSSALQNSLPTTKPDTFVVSSNDIVNSSSSTTRLDHNLTKTTTDNYYPSPSYKPDTSHITTRIPSPSITPTSTTRISSPSFSPTRIHSPLSTNGDTNQIVDLDTWSRKFQLPSAEEPPRVPVRRRVPRDPLLRSSIGSSTGSLQRIPRSPSQSSMTLPPYQRFSYTEMLSKVCSMGVLPTTADSSRRSLSSSHYNRSCSSSSSQVSELWSDLSEEQSAATHATEMLDSETTERMRLEKEVQELQNRYSHVQQRSDKMELEMMEARVYRSELNGDLSEDETDANSSIYKQKYERAVRDMEIMKRRIQQQQEDDMEQKQMIKKASDKKLAEALEDVEEERQVANQWKRKAQKLGSELQDLRMMLEEQMARNGELEKKQRRFDSELSAVQEEIKKERTLREKFSREKDQAVHEKYSIEQDLQSARIDMDMQQEKITQLNKELDELTLSSKGEEEVTQLKRAKQELERKNRDQEEELEEFAAQVQMLEQAKLRLEMSLEKLRQEHRRESSVKEEEIEEIRASSSKKIKSLEAQLESEQDERHQLVKQKHELERRLYEVTDQPPAQDPEIERRLRRDLKRTKALLRDAQSMLEHARDSHGSKAVIRQLKNQLEDAEFAKAAAVKARQAADSELQDLQAQLEEVTRVKNESESRCLQLSREKSAIQTQLEEAEEEMAEVMKKYKAVVAQMSIDQKSMVEQTQQIADLETERQMLKEQLSEVSHRFEHLAGQSEDAHKVHRLDGKVRELESKLELEQTTRARLDSQISRLKELNDRAREECDSLRSKELQAQEGVRRFQRQIRDLREDYATLQQKEADGYRKQHELEMALENTDADLQVTKNDLRLACQRIQDLQNALEEDLDSGTDVPDDSGSDTDDSSSYEMPMGMGQCMTPIQRCDSVSSGLSYEIDGRRSRTSSFSHELSAFSRMMLRRTSMDFLG